MRIVIPSYHRSGTIRTIDYLVDNGINEIIISLQCQDDVPKYKARFPDIEIAYTEGNSVSENRNNGLRYTRHRYPGEDILMMDDDIQSLILMKKEGNRKTAVVEHLKGDSLKRVLEKTFTFARQQGATLFGISTLDNPFFMRLNTARNSLFGGVFMGFVGGGDVYFDESFKLKEDYELCLRLMQDGKLTLKYRFIAPRTQNRAKGGCSQDRAAHKESEYADRLLEKYQGLIRLNPLRDGEIILI